MIQARQNGHLPVRIGYYLFITAVILAALFSLKQVAGALLVSLILSFLLSPVVSFAENRGIPRVVVVLSIYLIVVALLLLAVIFLGPILSDEAMRLAGDLPEYERQLETILRDLRVSLTERIPGLDLPDLYLYVKERLISSGGFDLGSILSRLSGLFSIIMILVIIPIITFFFIVDGHLIQKALLRLVPNRYFEMCVLLVN